MPIRRHSWRHWYTDSLFLRRALARSPVIERWVLDRMGDLALSPPHDALVVERVLARLHAISVSRGARFVPVLVPARDDFPVASKAFDWLAARAQAVGLDALDLHEEFRRRTAEPAELYYDRLHLTALGHRTLASILLEALEPN